MFASSYSKIDCVLDDLMGREPILGSHSYSSISCIIYIYQHIIIWIENSGKKHTLFAFFVVRRIVFVFLVHCNCMKKEINILARSVYLVWAVCPELSCQRQTLSLLTNLSQRFTFYNSMWFTVTFHNCIQIINTWISCWSSVKVIQIQRESLNSIADEIGQFINIDISDE